MGERDEADGWALATSERSPREREGGEALTGGARVSVGGERRADWAAWAGKGGGNAGARELGWKSAQPREGREFSFFFSYSNSFPFPFLLLCLFVSFSLATKIL
jgi:hypothetical protein